jgi:hypothetical protein
MPGLNKESNDMPTMKGVRSMKLKAMKAMKGKILKPRLGASRRWAGRLERDQPYSASMSDRMDEHARLGSRSAISNAILGKRKYSQIDQRVKSMKGKVKTMKGKNMKMKVKSMRGSKAKAKK